MSGEIIAIVEPDVEGDFCDWLVGMAQEAACPIDSLIDQPRKRRGSSGGLENPEEAPARHVGDLGQFLQIYFVVDVSL